MAPTWLAALLATLLMQTVATFLSQVVPVVAPILTAELGVRPEAVGNFSSLSTLGAILFLLFGTPLVARFGPARVLQAGTILGAAALALAGSGVAATLPLAAMLMGIGYGPTGPAGSRILQATAPPRHRVALAVAITLALLAVLLLQPMRRSLDAERDPAVRLRDAFRWRRLGTPLAALRAHPVLPPLTLQAFAFASLQGCLFSFTVTWLVEARGMTLTAAGTVFAVIQVAGVIGRLLLGWAADRIGDAMRSLAVHGVVAAALSALWVLAGPGAGWGVALILAALCGFTAASWNGIFLAEVARVAPPNRVAEASSGAILLCFLGYLLAPSAFALAVTLTGSWVAPFLAACVLLAVVSALVGVWRRG